MIRAIVYVGSYTEARRAKLPEMAWVLLALRVAGDTVLGVAVLGHLGPVEAEAAGLALAGPAVQRGPSRGAMTAVLEH